MFLELILNIQKLRELHNDYPLASAKIEMLCEYQLNIADLYNFPFGNVKKLVHNFYDKEKYVVHKENSQLYSRIKLKLKKYIAY